MRKFAENRQSNKEQTVQTLRPLESPVDRWGSGPIYNSMAIVSVGSKPGNINISQCNLNS